MMTILIFFQTFLFSFLPPQTTVFNKTLARSPEPLYRSVSGAASLASSNLAVGKVNHPDDFAKNDFRIKTVVVDAGHGGHDPGCLGANSQEKHIALAVSKRLAAAIEERYPEVKVILTRDKDVFIPLHERARIANRNSADLFISIHCNYFPNRESINGSETYVMGLHTAEHNLEVAKRENAVILLEDNYEKHYDYDPNSPEGHIMLSMYQNAHLEQSILFAEKVEGKINTEAKRRSRGVKQAGFVVLKETAMPSVLIETGFLSNELEERYLLTAEGQQNIAEAIVAAFGEYKGSVEVPAGSDFAPPVAQKETPAPTTKAAAPGTSAATPAVAPPGNNTPPPSVAPPATTAALAVTSQPAAAPKETKMTFSGQAPPLPDREKSSSATPVNISPPPPPNSNNPPLSIYVKQETVPPATTPLPDGTQNAAAPPPSISTSTLGTAIPPTGSAASPPAAGNPAGKQTAPEKIPGLAVPAKTPPPAEEKAAVFYCVQLAASPEPLETTLDNKWQKIPFPVELVEEDGMYKYQARQFDNLQEASKARADLRELGFFDAFVVAYKGEKRISVTEAKRELGQ